MLNGQRDYEVLNAEREVVFCVRLEIGVPYQQGEDWQWFTMVRITDLRDATKFESHDYFGVDALKSLVTALFTASIRMRVWQDAYRKQGLSLTWLGDEELGFDLFWRK